MACSASAVLDGAIVFFAMRSAGGAGVGSGAGLPQPANIRQISAIRHFQGAFFVVFIVV